MIDSYSLVLLNGTEHYNSIQEWASQGLEETRHTCTICNERVFIKYGFDNVPSLFVFEFSNQVLHINLLIDIKLQNDQHRLRLAGGIYYGQHHFTAQIILSDGQVWFYDGIDTGRNLIYNGSINSNPPSISNCRGRQAVAAIYVCLDFKKIKQGLVNAMQSNGPQTSILDHLIFYFLSLSMSLHI